MKNPFGFVLALCLGLYSLAGATTTQASEHDAWEKTRARLKREAIELFRVVLQDDKEKPAPCEFRTKWLEYPVPAQYFGSSLSADLVPSNVPADPAEIMDPSGTMREAFCNEADDDLRLSFLIETLKRRELRDGKDPTIRLNWLKIYRRDYTFPIFDKDYQRAVIVSSGLERFWYWKPDGQFRSGLEMMGGASIFEKRKGRWRFIRHDNFFHGHG